MIASTLARMARDGRVHAVQGSGTCFTPRVDRVLQDLKSFTQYAADLGMKPETRLLGLSMVEQIARIHNGRMSLSSRPGEGSAFTLHLPEAPENTLEKN